MKDKAVFLIGPTATGKTALSLRLAESFPIEIINVDSALIYQELDIGSAKPTLSQLQQVPHHLINIINPLQNYSVAEFIQDCRRLVSEINQRGHLPLLVGGTMMYYNALINGLSVLPAADEHLRSRLETQFTDLGNLAMHQQLASLDPAAAARIAINDKQRIMRALELYYLTGSSLSALHQKAAQVPALVNCDYLPLAIMPSNRHLLQERINQRFSEMLSLGLVNEVIQLRIKYPQLTAEHNSMRTIGYRQVWQYLDGELDSMALCSNGQAATRQLAKRQLTWLRRLPVVAIDDQDLSLSSLHAKLSHEIKRFVCT